MVGFGRAAERGVRVSSGDKPYYCNSFVYRFYSSTNGIRHSTLSSFNDASVSACPRQMLPKFEIGTLLTREFVPYKSDESGFYRDMCQRVGQVLYYYNTTV